MGKKGLDSNGEEFGEQIPTPKKDRSGIPPSFLPFPSLFLPPLDWTVDFFGAEKLPFVDLKDKKIQSQKNAERKFLNKFSLIRRNEFSWLIFELYFFLFF